MTEAVPKWVTLERDAAVETANEGLANGTGDPGRTSVVAADSEQPPVLG